MSIYTPLLHVVRAVGAAVQVQWNRTETDKFSAHADTNHNLFVRCQECTHQLTEYALSMPGTSSTTDYTPRL